MIGASGAVMAVVVLYALYYPRREVLLFFVLPVEMWLLVVIFLGYRRLAVVPRRTRPGRGGLAPDGGGLRLSSSSASTSAGRGSPGRRIRRPGSGSSRPSRARRSPRTAPARAGRRPGRRAQAPATAVLPEEQLDARLDEVLAKIAREGRGGPDRGGEPRAPGGQPPGPEPPERPALMTAPIRIRPPAGGPRDHRRVQPALARRPRRRPSTATPRRGVERPWPTRPAPLLGRRGRDQRRRRPGGRHPRVERLAERLDLVVPERLRHADSRPGVFRPRRSSRAGSPT